MIKFIYCTYKPVAVTSIVDKSKVTFRSIFADVTSILTLNETADSDTGVDGPLILTVAAVIRYAFNVIYNTYLLLSSNITILNGVSKDTRGAVVVISTVKSSLPSTSSSFSSLMFIH